MVDCPTEVVAASEAGVRLRVVAFTLVDVLEEDVDALGADVDALGADVDTLEADVDAVGAGVDAVRMEVDALVADGRLLEVLLESAIEDTPVLP